MCCFINQSDDLMFCLLVYLTVVFLYLSSLGYVTEVKFGSVPVSEILNVTCELERYLRLPLDGSSAVRNNFRCGRAEIFYIVGMRHSDRF